MPVKLCFMIFVCFSLFVLHLLPSSQCHHCDKMFSQWITWAEIVILVKKKMQKRHLWLSLFVPR